MTFELKSESISKKAGRVLIVPGSLHSKLKDFYQWKNETTPQIFTFGAPLDSYAQVWPSAQLMAA